LFVIGVLAYESLISNNEDDPDMYELFNWLHKCFQNQTILVGLTD